MVSIFHYGLPLIYTSHSPKILFPSIKFFSKSHHLDTFFFLKPLLRRTTITAIAVLTEYIADD